MVSASPPRCRCGKAIPKARYAYQQRRYCRPDCPSRTLSIEQKYCAACSKPIPMPPAQGQKHATLRHLYRTKKKFCARCAIKDVGARKRVLVPVSKVCERCGCRFTKDECFSAGDFRRARICGACHRPRYDFFGEKLSAGELAAIAGCARVTLLQRLQRGLSPTDAVALGPNEQIKKRNSVGTPRKNSH